jgi:choline dehydrogenase-like flavoprotein
MSGDYDLVVVGAGAAGTIVAMLAAEAGKRVLLIERGREMSYATDGQRDHLRNQRLSRHGHNAGPAILGNPRVFVEPDGSEMIVRPHQSGYHNNAAAVGSGTVVYGAQAWRFLPEDFAMASRYGVPSGSSLANWPITYEDLAPFYQRAEWEIGVAAAPKLAGSRQPLADHYPMPPVPQFSSAAVLRRGAAAMGFDTLVPPLLINTQSRAGRAACIGCGSCVGFPCPTDAKNGTQNTALPRALATGKCELLPNTTVTSINTDASGEVSGVTLVEEGNLEARRIKAAAVVVSCGAIETARLLLLSHSDKHENGLGNNHGQVGRHLQGHYYPSAYGWFDRDIHDDRGPGVTIATTHFNHGNAGIIGGGMLADDFIMLPAIFWKTALPPDLPRWGRAAKDFMRDGYRRVLAVKGPVHEIPSPNARVTLDQHVTDSLGLPVARLSGTTHPETVRTAQFMFERASDWLQAAGARRVWGREPKLRLSAGQHQAGTCRMGETPQASVTDRWGRVWGHNNLFVCDGSLHPTNGGFNPVLTIMAMAFRNGAHIAASI